MRGMQMARNAAVVFVLRESLFNITSYTASKKRRTQIVMIVPIKISLSAIADEVLDERLLRPPEGSVAISAITRKRGCQYKRFSRCALRGSHRALIAILRPIAQQRHLIRASSHLHNPLEMKAGQRRSNTEVTKNGPLTRNRKQSLYPWRSSSTETSQTRDLFNRYLRANRICRRGQIDTRSRRLP